MSTGAQYVDIKSKRLLGVDDFGTRFLEYMRAKAVETNKGTYDASVVVGGQATLVADGADRFRFNKTNLTDFAADGLGEFLDYDFSQWDWFRYIYFQNTLATAYYVALKHCTVPAGIQINPRTGAPEYIAYEDQVGELDNPDSVVDGGTDITFVVDSVLETSVDCTGRRVWVYMANPADGATSEAIAIEECVVFYSAGQNQITTTGLLGQTTVLTSTSYYRVVAKGPTVKRYTDLRGVSGYVFIGIVTGAGAGNPPTVFDMADQQMIPYSWVSALVDGLPQDLLPSTDNTYNLGSASKRWASIYTANLVISGDLLPVNDATQDLGSASFRWNELHLAGQADVHNVLPESDDTYYLGTSGWRWYRTYTNSLYLGVTPGDGVQSSMLPGTTSVHDLGNASYKWKDLRVDGVGYIDTLNLGAGAGEGIGTNLYPTVTNTHDLGSATFEWKDLHLDGVAYIDRISLQAPATGGVVTDFHPQADTTHSLGSASYRWYNIYGVFGAIDSIQLQTGVGQGVWSDLEPSATNVRDLGTSSYMWKDLWVGSTTSTQNLLVASAAGLGVAGHLVPKLDNSYNLGNASYTWWDAWIDGTAHIETADIAHLDLSTASGYGCDSHFVPSVNGTRNLGASGYRWNDGFIDKVTCADQGTFNGKLYVSDTAGDGVNNHLVPSVTNNEDLGNATYYWRNFYADAMFYKAGGAPTTFDNLDDLALIEAYTPTEKTMEKIKGTAKRLVHGGDMETVPWPMLGATNKKGEQFIDQGDSMMFLLGGVKQLFQLHKKQVSELREIIDGLTKRLEDVEAPA